MKNKNIKEKSDTNASKDTFMSQISLSSAQYERARRREDIRRGLAHKKAQALTSASNRSLKKMSFPARVQTEEEIDIRDHFGHMWEILGQDVSEEIWAIITNDLEKADLVLCPEARRVRNASILKDNATRHE